MKCIQCKKRDVAIQKWRLCTSCYQKHYRKDRNAGEEKGASCKSTMQKHETISEIEFIKNFFDHGNWFFEPTIFRLNGCSYTPDFYDAKRNVFIEVVGTRQAYHYNKGKYELFRKTFPLINFEIRQRDGSLLDEAEGRLQWANASTASGSGTTNKEGNQ